MRCAPSRSSRSAGGTSSAETDVPHSRNTHPRRGVAQGTAPRRSRHRSRVPEDAERLSDIELAGRFVAEVDRTGPRECVWAVDDQEVVGDDRRPVERESCEGRALPAAAVGDDAPGAALVDERAGVERLLTTPVREEPRHGREKRVYQRVRHRVLGEAERRRGRGALDESHRISEDDRAF